MVRKKERNREGGRKKRLFKGKNFKSPHHYTKLIFGSSLGNVRLRSPVTTNPTCAEQNLTERRIQGWNRAERVKKCSDGKTHSGNKN